MSASKSRGVSLAEVRRIVLSFPGSSEGTSYGKPSFLIAGKFFTRLRSEDDSLVLIVDSIDERDMLLEAEPSLFHITEHYRNYPAVLARRSVIAVATLRGMLERRWRVIAPKRLVKEFDAGSGNAPGTRDSRRNDSRQGAGPKKSRNE